MSRATLLEDDKVAMQLTNFILNLPKYTNWNTTLDEKSTVPLKLSPFA